MDKEVFVLLNDEVVKEFHNLYELIIDITVEELKLSGKAFFYKPVGSFLCSIQCRKKEGAGPDR